MYLNIHELPRVLNQTLNLKCNVMKKSTLVDFHISEGVRNAIIVLAIFGVIAFITYMEWSNKIN